MSEDRNDEIRAVPSEESEISPKGSQRRKFLGQIGMAAAMAAGSLGKPQAAAAQSGENGPASPAESGCRASQAFQLRVAMARQQMFPCPPHTTNGDLQRYPDRSGTYTKGVKQASPGVVDPAAFQSFMTAVESGQFQDFEKVAMGGTITLNNPQGGMAFNLEGTDSRQFGNASCPQNQESAILVPPAPAVASHAYGTELIELYWGSLLRDVAFTDYPTNSLAAMAAAELNAQPDYAGPRDQNGHVTPANLFRGGFSNNPNYFPGETLGPYVSQFAIIPTALGQQPISQLLTTYAPNLDYMTDLSGSDCAQLNGSNWFKVQNGISTGLANIPDPAGPQYLHNGRGFGAYTFVDVLYQAYFVAYLVMGTLGVPLNPGNPYVGSKTENGFATFGGPDFAASVAAAAIPALKNVWYQKWFVHLRHRPESGGGLVHIIKAGCGNTVDATLNANVLNSHAVQQSYQKYGSYLLSQAFPQGSPYHPAYPTGHGVVGGACITMLKFFYDGSFVIPKPMVPSSDGLSLLLYTGPDAGQLTVNGELNKLGHNISFGHGIHAGIHWRSDTDYSLLLGEACALSMLRDRARTYNEPFTVTLQKFDGTTATITNM